MCCAYLATAYLPCNADAPYRISPVAHVRVHAVTDIQRLVTSTAHLSNGDVVALCSSAIQRAAARVSQAASPSSVTAADLTDALAQVPTAASDARADIISRLMEFELACGSSTHV